MEILFKKCHGAESKIRWVSSEDGMLEVYCPVCGRACRFSAHRLGRDYVVNAPDTVKKIAEKWNEGVI